MPKRKPRPPNEKPQRERFIEAARAAGVDETGETFERALRRIIAAPRPAVASEDKAQERRKAAPRGDHS